jgi:putative ABC transport system ATP-binding protein
MVVLSSYVQVSFARVRLVSDRYGPGRMPIPGVAPGDPAIRCVGLTKRFGEGPAAVTALDDVSLDIQRGEFVVLLGPSGSGKTTLLNLIGALEPPTSGSITVFGRELSTLDEESRTAYRLEDVGFVFQFFNLVPTLTACENVALLAELTGPRGDERAAEVLRRVGLQDRLGHFPAQLSGGEQQRVAIARGLVKEPRLLLCDEPTGALDVQTGKQVLRVLRELAQGPERTVVIVTHNAVISRIGDRVIRLRDGRIGSDETNQRPESVEALDW